MHAIRRFTRAVALTAVFVPALWSATGSAAEGADEAIVSRIEALSSGFPVQVLGDALMAHKALPAFYSGNGYRHAWHSTELRQQLAEVIESASDDGLNPEDYHASVLSELAPRPMSEFSAEHQADIDLLFSDAFLVFGSHLLEGKVNPQTIHAEWTANRRQRHMESVLADALASGNVAATLESLRPANPAYRQLMQARKLLTRVVGEPWPVLQARPTLRPGDRDERVQSVRYRLAILGDLTTGIAAVDDPPLYDSELEAAVASFQARHGLDADGIIGRDTITALNMRPTERIRQIDATLERWRWLPDSLGETYVLVNIAGFELTMVESGAEVLRKRVIVGQPFRQTPVFSDQIDYLVFNPTWTVPRSIMLKDQLPKIVQDPNYLSSLNIQVYQGWGANRQPVDPATIDWASLGRNNFPYQLVQEPGPLNALGQVKFMFPNQYDVYLHDTPGRGLFAKTERTFSSGCIRVEQPFDLAERLLAQAPQWTRSRIESTITGSSPQTVMLPRPVPVHIQYWTTWVDGEGRLQFRNDIYERDGRLINELRGTLEDQSA